MQNSSLMETEVRGVRNPLVVQTQPPLPCTAALLRAHFLGNSGYELQTFFQKGDQAHLTQPPAAANWEKANISNKYGGKENCGAVEIFWNKFIDLSVAKQEYIKV